MSDCNLCALLNMVHSASETRMLLKQLPNILQQNILKVSGDLTRSVELNNASLPFDRFDETRSKKQRALLVMDKKGNGACSDQRGGNVGAEGRDRAEGCKPFETAASSEKEEPKMVFMGASGSQERSATPGEISQVLSQRPHMILCFPKNGALSYVLMNGASLKTASSEQTISSTGLSSSKKTKARKGNGGSLLSAGSSPTGISSRRMEKRETSAGQVGAKRAEKGKEKAADHHVLNLSSLPTGFSIHGLLPPLDDGELLNSTPNTHHHRMHSWPTVPPLPCPSSSSSSFPEQQAHGNSQAQPTTREDYDPEKFTRFANFLVNMEPPKGLSQGLEEGGEGEMLPVDELEGGGRGEDEAEEEIVVDDVNLGSSLQALTDNLRLYASPTVRGIEPPNWAFINTFENAATTNPDTNTAHGSAQELHDFLIPEVPMSWLVDPSEVMKRHTNPDTSGAVDTCTSEWTSPLDVDVLVTGPPSKEDATTVGSSRPATSSSGGRWPTAEQDASFDLSPDTLKLLLPFGAPSPQAPNGPAQPPEGSGQTLSPISQLFESFAPPDCLDVKDTATFGESDNPLPEKANNSGSSLSHSNSSMCSTPLGSPPTAREEADVASTVAMQERSNASLSSASLPGAVQTGGNNTSLSVTLPSEMDELLSDLQSSPSNLLAVATASSSANSLGELHLQQTQSLPPATFHSHTTIDHRLHSVPAADLSTHDMDYIMCSAQVLGTEGRANPQQCPLTPTGNVTSLPSQAQPYSSVPPPILLSPLSTVLEQHPLALPTVTLSQDGVRRSPQFSPTSLPNFHLTAEDYRHRSSSLSPRLLPGSSLRSVSPLEDITEGIQMELQSSPLGPPLQRGSGVEVGDFDHYQSNSSIPSSPSLASISSQSTASVQDFDALFDASDSPSVLELCELLSESPNVQQKDFSHMTLSGKCVCVCVFTRGAPPLFNL